MRYTSEMCSDVIQIGFKCKLQQQKLLIDAILKYSNLIVDKLAELLEVPPDELRKVHYGMMFLNIDQGARLIQLFIICFEG